MKKLTPQDLSDLRFIALNKNSRSAVVATERTAAELRITNRHCPDGDTRLIGRLDGWYYILDGHGSRVTPVHPSPMLFTDPDSVVSLTQDYISSHHEGHP